MMFSLYYRLWYDLFDSEAAWCVFVVSSMEFIISEGGVYLSHPLWEFRRADGKHHVDSHVETALLDALYDDGRYTQVHPCFGCDPFSAMCTIHYGNTHLQGDTESAPWRSSWPPSHASGRLPIFAHRRDHHGHAITSPRWRDRSRNCSRSVTLILIATGHGRCRHRLRSSPPLVATLGALSFSCSVLRQADCFCGLLKIYI